jgi:phosphoribosylaminoimidazole (AIR) synthetase
MKTITIERKPSKTDRIFDILKTRGEISAIEMVVVMNVGHSGATMRDARVKHGINVERKIVPLNKIYAKLKKIYGIDIQCNFDGDKAFGVVWKLVK